MTLQTENARRFADLHIPGSPLILFNIWDAGSAKAVQEAGARAIATGSWSVAAAHGLADGEQLTLDLALANLERIVASVDLPVTIDFEGGYATETAALGVNITRAIDAGAIGINFEDQIVGGSGLYTVEAQAARIAAARNAAEGKTVPLFINARTDLFLNSDPSDHAGSMDEAIERASAYAGSGASGFFAPGLRDADLIKRLCAASPLPVNIMVMADTPSPKEMAEAGVARISYGPGPYLQMIEALKSASRATLNPEP